MIFLIKIVTWRRQRFSYGRYLQMVQTQHNYNAAQFFEFAKNFMLIIILYEVTKRKTKKNIITIVLFKQL